MVLICNNSILTIEKFHKHRCEAKAAIKYIIYNRKYLKDEYEETPVVEHKATKEDVKRFIASVGSIGQIKRMGPITFSKSI